MGVGNSNSISNYSFKSKRTAMCAPTLFKVIAVCMLVVTLPILVFLHVSSSIPFCPSAVSAGFYSSDEVTVVNEFSSWTGDLREAKFSWNHLWFDSTRPPPEILKIAVFSRKWPVGSAPGGMERHALTLHSFLAARGHDVHVFTSAPPVKTTTADKTSSQMTVHYIDAAPNQWKPELAWPLFKAENKRSSFDAVHSESVALPYRLAAELSNLAVSWHGIALEAFESSIFQDLARPSGERVSPAFVKDFNEKPMKIINEIRFFHSYSHHVAISDSSGDMLRDVYQIPHRRVHVILNGVDDAQFTPDPSLGRSFRSSIGVPENASLVLGVAGRLVKDKGHPLLHQAFSRITGNHADVYLVVAGSGPWAKRYANLGTRVVALGALPPSRLKAFYNGIDVFLNPTLRPQGLDLTLMEAMQCGTPVAATRFPSIKGSVVVDDEFGHMFAPNVDSLVNVLEKVVKEGRRRLSERGRKCRVYAKKMFAAGKMALAYERMFLCIKNERYCQYPTII
ncbi:Glycosyltransferase, family GT4 [Zostera marina]|uniref:Glycosyltransferase, family GT4 n=1 Tax=Zostera marina TaxID=29655 RepID=A0A0K9PJD9_ZOSMR|nr:Glycosyltransferase, family GT4 [Zostera marina]